MTIKHLLSYLEVPYAVDIDHNIILLSIIAALLVVSSWQILRSTGLSLLINISTFSILNVSVYLLMDAPDVAMTEAALGSALSTVILLRALKLLGTPPPDDKPMILPILFILVSVIVLCFMGRELANYGRVGMIQSATTTYYLTHTLPDINIASCVAAILASYRGYDTLGETTVIFIAAVICLLCFKKLRAE